MLGRYFLSVSDHSSTAIPFIPIDPDKYAAYLQEGNVNKHDPFLARINVDCIMVRQSHVELSPLHTRFYNSVDIHVAL